MAVTILATTPGLAQHGARAARPGVARTGIVRAPHVPVTSSHGSVGGFRGSGAAFRGFSSVRRRHGFPFFPFIAWPGLYGWGWFGDCGGFYGWGYGCGAWSPYYNFAPAEPPYVAPQYSPGNFSGYDLGVGAETNVGELPRQILLYLKDGSVFAVSKYTVSGGKLHYVTLYGAENDIEVDLLDVQRTIDENAARGVTFTLTPNPAPTPPDTTAPPTGPGTISPPK